MKIMQNKLECIVIESAVISKMETTANNAVMKSDTHKKKSKKMEWLKVNNENFLP